MRPKKAAAPVCLDVGKEVNLANLSEDSRALYVLLSEKIDYIVQELVAKTARLEKCEEENKVLREKLVKLEAHVDDVETQYRNKNLVISGKKLAGLSGDNLANSAVQLLRQHVQYELSPEKIVSVYRLGARPQGQTPDKRSFILKLKDEDTKRDLLSAFRAVKPTDLYGNDDLTPTRARLLYLLRQAKKKTNGKMVACGSINGIVYAFIKPPSSSARNQKVYVKDMASLESLCERVLGISLSALTVDANQ